MLLIFVQIAPYLSIFYTRSPPPPPPPMKNVGAHLLGNLIHISIRILANVHVDKFFNLSPIYQLDVTSRFSSDRLKSI
jgi:hypothetical protein